MSDTKINPSPNVAVDPRYLPEGSSTGSTSFQDVMNTVGSGLRTAASFAGVGAIGEVADFAAYSSLLEQQMQAQVVMQQVSMQSNVEKAKHETSMAPIRNIRVS